MCGIQSAAQRELSKDGFEAHLATNYLGTFLLVLLLLPVLEKAVSYFDKS
jgi:NAD(P)-dependent dehydrogenase (short-subunit alcohol dehydrogenase family)